MSICDCLSDQQVQQIISIIRNQCAETARREAAYRSRISNELYTLLKKGRGAHDVTADIYIGFFLPENRIEGINVATVNNGIYIQPELRAENTTIHIFHKSNALSSQLVVNNANDTEKHYFCILYDLDRDGHLKTIEAVNMSGNVRECENLYTRPVVVAEVG